MEEMFSDSVFNQDISNWIIVNNCNLKKMFEGCPIKNSFKAKHGYLEREIRDEVSNMLN